MNLGYSLLVYNVNVNIQLPTKVHVTQQYDVIKPTVEKIYDLEYERQVKRAYLMLGNQATAIDVVSEAFVELINRYESIAKPQAYLHTIVLNGCRKAGRKAKKEDSLDGIEPATHDIQEDLDDCLNKLSHKQRAMVVMKFYEGLTEQEIAYQLDCRAGSIGPTVNRALKILKRELQ